jgi:hypothetical protein
VAGDYQGYIGNLIGIRVKVYYGHRNTFGYQVRPL